MGADLIGGIKVFFETFPGRECVDVLRREGEQVVGGVVGVVDVRADV
ncbi:MAG: hypothetical protein ACYTEE_04795 [Planctomycetota bacterium]